MTNNAAQLSLIRRKPLNEITTVPDDLISVYTVEKHIWASEGSNEAKRQRQAELRTVQEFLINPVRSFLNDFFRQLAAPYDPKRKDNPVGQGWWIQAEFGSGKSHLLSFIGALALGDKASWDLVREKEEKTGLGRRESLYSFYEGGLSKKTQEGKGILIAVKTLIGQGGGTVGLTETGRGLHEYVLDGVADQFFAENGRSLPLYPAELLAKRFIEEDHQRFQRDLAKFLKDSRFFDAEEQEELADFMQALRSTDSGVLKDCGRKLWTFYTEYLKVRPQIPMEVEDILKHMVEALLEEGYTGLLLILDEVSLFMKGRSDNERIDDEKALVVLSNRLAKVENLPVWTVCAAQQQIETKMAGAKNILARERLDLVNLLDKQDYYYDIALSRVRTITDPTAIDQYYEDYKRSFSWVQATGRDKFGHFFPFYPPGIDVVRSLSYGLTTIRSALYFMLQTLKTQRKKESRELISLWGLFDDVVDYTEDPSGTTRSIAAIKIKYPDEWTAFEAARHELDSATKGHLKVYRNRCEKILRTLFLYYVSGLAPNGLSPEDLMNVVMEWKDHDKTQQADLQDNLDHYEALAGAIDTGLVQVEKIGTNYAFNAAGGKTDPREYFQRARTQAEGNEREYRDAWNQLLALGKEPWLVQTHFARLDLDFGTRSVFREIAPNNQTDVTVRWRGREVKGRVFMRDLLRDIPATSINSAETDLDFGIYISSEPAVGRLDRLVAEKKDGRMLFWAPDALSPSEQGLLLDFIAYRAMVREFQGKDSEEAKDMLTWVQMRLRDEIGKIYHIVPDSYGRGRVACTDHANMEFTVQGELGAVLTPLVGQALDTVYLSKTIDCSDAPTPFNDTLAISVINGIVKVGEIPRNAKPDKDISAAQNYGFALKIMKRPNNRKLDLDEPCFARDMANWIEEKLGESGSAMPITTLYKNFMGVGGAWGRNYGLSRGLVQLYLLCLAREGKVRITLGGRSPVAEAIDYSNIANLDFKKAVLDSFDQVQRLKPPEGWELLAPFAAILLDAPELARAQRDEEIQKGLQRTLDYQREESKPFGEFLEGLGLLFKEITFAPVENPLGERLTAWKQFLEGEVGSLSEAIPYLLHGLDTAFAYRVYTDSTVQQAEVDDFKTRWDEVQQVRKFYEHRDRLRTAIRYAAYDIPDIAQMQEVRHQMARVRDSFTDSRLLMTFMGSEASLNSDLLEPAHEAIQTYRTAYLTVFDEVNSVAEQARNAVLNLPNDPVYSTLTWLSTLEPLGADARPELEARWRKAHEQIEQVVPARLTHADVERELRDYPQPRSLQLTVNNAPEAKGFLEEVVSESQEALWQAVLHKAKLLNSPSLHERLKQGQHEPFIAGMLACDSAEKLAHYLINSQEANPGSLLSRYLKKIKVRKLRLADFDPGRHTLEKPADAEEVSRAFHAFLLAALSADEDELPIVELE